MGEVLMPPAVRIGLSLAIAIGLLGAVLYLVAPGALGIPPKVTWETWDFDYAISFHSAAECMAWRSQALEDRIRPPPECKKVERW